jgi:hypothetical protein
MGTNIHSSDDSAHVWARIGVVLGLFGAVFAVVEFVVPVHTGLQRIVLALVSGFLSLLLWRSVDAMRARSLDVWVLMLMVVFVGAVVLFSALLVSERDATIAKLRQAAATASPVPTSTTSPTISSSGSATPKPFPTGTTSPSASTGPQPSEEDPGAVRRSTGDRLITLSRGYSADLDSMNPNWDVGYAETESRFDVSFSGGGAGELHGDAKSDFAVVGGTPTVETCRSATGYINRLDSDEARVGVNLCMRTSERRFASIYIEKVIGENRDQIQLRVTVWDPPFE